MIGKMAEQLVPGNSWNEPGSVEDLVFVATDRLRERLEKLTCLLREADLGLCAMEVLLVGPHPTHTDPEAFCDTPQGAASEDLMARMRNWFSGIESGLNVAIDKAIAINETRRRLHAMIFSESNMSGRQLKQNNNFMSKSPGPLGRPLATENRRSDR